MNVTIWTIKQNPNHTERKRGTKCCYISNCLHYEVNIIPTHDHPARFFYINDYLKTFQESKKEKR